MSHARGTTLTFFRYVVISSEAEIRRRTFVRFRPLITIDIF